MHLLNNTAAKRCFYGELRFIKNWIRFKHIVILLERENNHFDILKIQNSVENNSIHTHGKMRSTT